MSDLTFTTRETPHTVTLILSGEIDLSSRDALDAATRVTPPAGAALCLDMSAVTFMDSSGLNFLLILHRRLAEHGSPLVLTGIQQEPMRVLTLTGADAILLPPGERAPHPRTVSHSGPLNLTRPSGR
ncbi:STAS domain-containing protein [Streptomyces sp. NPDC048018]|uniref:STAS domain-containing protein n=1 Tax=Streptomyces sp. NPDC048018 TaxID=3365499 RepID=UPI003718DABF